MFLFVGGIAPRGVSKATALQCLKCSAPLVERRWDHVLYLFFLPVWTISKGQPVLECPTCGWRQDVTSGQSATSAPAPHSLDDAFRDRSPWRPSAAARKLEPPRDGRSAAGDVNELPVYEGRKPAPSSCPGCTRAVLDPEWYFCPACGAQL